MPFSRPLLLALLLAVTAPAHAEGTPVAWLLANRASWPAEVVLAKDTTFPVVINGAVAGSLKAPAGTTVKVSAITAEAVTVTHNGASVSLPFAATDLSTRAEAAFQKSQSSPAPAAAAEPPTASAPAPAPIAAPTALQPRSVPNLPRKMITLSEPLDTHVTGKGTPIAGTAINFTSPDAWLFLDEIPPSTAMKWLGQMRINGQPAQLNANIRVVQYGRGSVIIPQSAHAPAMMVFSGPSQSGPSLPLEPYVAYNDAKLGRMKKAIRSFRLERGYMATIAANEDGTGVSRNYVAQDHDIVIDQLPEGLDSSIRFIRIFPWRWVSKKGMAGDIWPAFRCGWFYNWNLNKDSTPDIEYVAIRQNRWWPGLDKQDWKTRGISHLLGYNEPNAKDQSNMSVDDAIAGWPDLLATGLRVGSPAPTDGGIGWLMEFLEKAKAKNLRVDFIAVHYYRSFSNPKDPEGAARNFHNFLKGIHDRTGLPIWITEWNNGANWTKDPDPSYSEQKAAIAAMIKMLDETPWVERYAIYNWVEDTRFIQRKNGSLTPAGEVYRDDNAPIGFVQPDYR